MPKSLTFSEARDRFKDRDDIELLEEGYVSFEKKGKFLDKILNETWVARIGHVYRNKSVHPKRSKEKAKNTNLARWGHENPFSSEIIKKKIKNTNLKKYGVENPQQNKKIKNKTKQTCIKKYGKDNIFKTKLFSRRTIKETKESFIDWHNKQPSPKPAYSTLIKVIPNEEVSIEDIREYYRHYNSNKTRLEIFLESLFKIKHYNQKPDEINSIYRPDFRLSETVFLNADGLYWHSSACRQDKYCHFNLRKEFEEHGLRIFQFRENEIYKKNHIVKSIVNNVLGKSENKIWARKCHVKQIPHKEAKRFLEENHMMGSTTAKHIGLYFDDRLISIMSYKQRGKVCKIERFCSVVDHSVVGGFSKLLNHIENNCLKEEIEEIHNWVDLRYGTGSHLLEKGFVVVKNTLGWRWTDYKETYNRLRCRANMDDRGLTEAQHAQELGWVKIYDAGQRLLVKNIK